MAPVVVIWKVLEPRDDGLRDDVKGGFVSMDEVKHDAPFGGLQAIPVDQIVGLELEKMEGSCSTAIKSSRLILRT